VVALRIVLGLPEYVSVKVGVPAILFLQIKLEGKQLSNAKLGLASPRNMHSQVKVLRSAGRTQKKRVKAQGLGNKLEGLNVVYCDYFLHPTLVTSKRAREERALAAERRLQMLQAQSQGMCPIPLHSAAGY
jgi:hypothetical protein